jgi:endo-1,4-beta-xylanase
VRRPWLRRRGGLIVSTDDEGVARFRGFFGKYELRVTRPDGSIERIEIRLRRGEANQWEFRL